MNERDCFLCKHDATMEEVNQSPTLNKVTLERVEAASDGPRDPKVLSQTLGCGAAAVGPGGVEVCSLFRAEASSSLLESRENLSSSI
jgi:hypothetical protein